MGSNKFTEEEQELLRKNPYVVKVSQTTITYSEQFKQQFFTAYQHGEPPSKILRDMGFNPGMLGKRRKDSLIRRVKEYSIREKGFEDARGENFSCPSTKELTDAERIARLEHQVNYLKEENQF